MDDKPLFQGMDEIERTYAPQQLPPDDAEQARVRLEEEGGDATYLEPPEAAPVANLGTAPSAAAAPPNIGEEDGVGAPGDPDTVAEDPFDTDDNRDLTR